MSVMHFHHFQIKIWPENFSSFAREPKEGVDAGGIIAGPNDWDFSFVIQNFGFLLVCVAGGANYECLAMLGAQCGTGGGGTVQAEVDDRIAVGDEGGQVVTFVHASNDIDAIHRLTAGSDHLPHAPS